MNNQKTKEKKSVQTHFNSNEVFQYSEKRHTINPNGHPRLQYCFKFIPDGRFFFNSGVIVASPFKPMYECCFIRNGRLLVDGNFFRCLTCCNDKDNIFICEDCAKHCHIGHELKQHFGFKGHYCSCCSGGINNECKIIPKEITRCQCDPQNTNGLIDVYYCRNCDISVCETCALVCHDHHMLDFAQKNAKCECGSNTKCVCKVNPISEEMLAIYCTFEITKRNYKPQHCYTCNTCGVYPPQVLCDNCVEICHKGHDVVDIGFSNAFCDCIELCHCRLEQLHKNPTNPKVKWNHKCSRSKLNNIPTKQKMYECETCEIAQRQGICKSCALMCHRGHQVKEVGMNSFVCQCKSKKCKLADCNHK